MKPISLFKHCEQVLFEQLIKDYYKSVNYHDFVLSKDELEQLSWQKGNTFITPEARGKALEDKIHFEIKRILARVYSFELLMRGDEKAYQEFIQDQNQEVALSFRAFQKMSQEARSLPQEIKAVIRASCFLGISNKGQDKLKKHGFALSNDSEEFLTQSATLAKERKISFPIIKHFSQAQLDLLPKIYWPNTHLRHMICTEGGENMFNDLREGILNETFTNADFIAWKWRWLASFFGFQGGRAARHYDAINHQLTELVIAELEKIFINPDHTFLESYLKKRAELAGINAKTFQLSAAEHIFLGHLLAYAHQLSFLYPQLGGAIYNGYFSFKNDFNDAGALASLYENYRKDTALLTPTYVPAVLNNTYLIFKKHFQMDDMDSMQNAVRFTCQMLSSLFAERRDNRISCQSFAKEANLEKLIDNWYHSPHSLQFEINDNNEFQVKTLDLTLRNAI